MVDYLEQNVAEFASRWKQKLSPDSVAAGKNIGAEIRLNKRIINNPNLKNNPKELTKEVIGSKKQARITAQQGRTNLNSAINNSKSKSSFNDPNKKQFKPAKRGNTVTVQRPLAAPNRIRAVKATKIAQTKRTNEAFENQLKGTLDPKPINYRAEPRPPLSDTPKPLPKAPTTSTPTVQPKTNIPKPQGNGLLKSVVRKNKILAGVGAGIGVTALGAGIYSRMKKNKK